LKGSAPYEDRRVFAMDAASGFAARSLNCREGDRVLDLCCAPGAKLLCLAEAVGVNGAVDGVDVSEKRLSIARKLLDAHHDPNKAARVRLYKSDGRRFPDERELLYDSRAADSFEQRGARKRLNKSARQREAKRLKALPEEDCAEAYDRVLVDADCTTDGSHAHVQKMVDKGTSVANVATERCASLIELQAALLRNGFGRLRNGGVLVYGTCSLTKAQNEDVVEAFLREEPAARLMSLEAPPVAVAGALPGTVRFPAGGETSGLFVARLEKIT
jgi:16S rRNA C967 or C1407 C5-methylase (RsmB/RsmF family)